MLRITSSSLREKRCPRVCIYKVPHGRQFNKRVGLTSETGSRGLAILGDWTLFLF